MFILITACACLQRQPAAAQPVAGSADPGVQEPIGRILAVQGSATIEHNALIIVQASLAASAPPRAGDAVYQGDVIRTGADGKVEVVFSDGTAFNVARNARIELNEFIYDPNSKSNSTKMSLTKGTLTFVAGQVAKSGSMQVKTPVGTMGIRGTTPRVEILDNGSVKFSTLVEDGRPDVTQAPGGLIPPRTQPPQRQGRAAPPQDPEYNKFIRNRPPKICVNC
jgi:hypothetical protein